MKQTGFVFITGCGMLLINLVVSKIAYAIAPSLEGEYANTAIFRMAADPRMLFFWLVPFITAALMLLIWNLAKNGVKGSEPVRKGINFGLIYWALTVPGMIMSFCTFQLSLAIVVSWAISNLCQYLFVGVMYARWRN